MQDSKPQAASSHLPSDGKGQKRRLHHHRHKKPSGQANAEESKAPAPAPKPAAQAPKPAAQPTKRITTVFSCPICLQDTAQDKRKGLNPIQFVAFGTCDHKVCSTCALRLRCKSKEMNCPMCKSSTPFMVVAPLSDGFERFTDALASVPFPWPYDLSTVSLHDVQGPGFLPDIETKMLFVNCDAFFHYMANLKAIHCPIRNCSLCIPNASTQEKAEDGNAVHQPDPSTVALNGAARFRSVPQLLSHLQKDHNGMTMCRLCLDNRPLFISEHEVFYNAHKFKQHLKGQGNLAANTGTKGSGNAYLLGHPECKLCHMNFFDASALYKHLQHDHYSCTLCDRQYMFRYYKNIQALREHHNQMHYVCNLCHRDPSIRNSDILYAFKHFTEFSEHMKQMHHVYDASKYLVTPMSSVGPKDAGSAAKKAGAGGKAGSGGAANAPDAPQYMDLDVGTASPFTNQPPAPGSAGTLVSAPRPPMTSHYRNSILSNIPTNMTVAGRVTSSGRFVSMAADEMEALQIMIDDNTDHQQPPAVAMSRTQLEEHFPDLPLAAGLATDYPGLDSTQGSKPSIHQAHPLSLINKKPASTASKPDSGDEASRKPVSRHKALAEAFGVATEGPEAYVHAHKLQPILDRLSYLQLPKTYLVSYLYPWEVISWARKNKGELLKIESKMTSFITSGISTQSSVQFKPMPYLVRSIVHVYAKYCHLNSYEFDPESRRYVSLVKRMDSFVPYPLLSAAAEIPLTVSFPGDAKSVANSSATLSDGISMLYFVLKAGIYSSWVSPTDGSKSKVGAPNAFNSRLLIVGEVIAMIQQVLEAVRDDYCSIFQSSSSFDPSNSNEFYNQIAVLHREVVENNLAVSIELDYVEQSGPHVIGIGMHSRLSAVLAALYLNEVDYWEYHNNQVAMEVLRLFQVQTSFEMPSIDTSVLSAHSTSPGGSQPPLGEAALPPSSSIPPPPSAEVEDSRGMDHWGDEEEAEDRDFHASSGYVVVEKPVDAQFATKPADREVVADWEDALETGNVESLTSLQGRRTQPPNKKPSVDDEWERFLAEKRAQRPVAESSLYVARRGDTSSGQSARPTELYAPKKAIKPLSDPSSGDSREPSSQAALSSRDISAIPAEFLDEHFQASALSSSSSTAHAASFVGGVHSHDHSEGWVMTPYTSVRSSSATPNAGVVAGKEKGDPSAKRVTNRYEGFESDSESDH